MLRLGHNELMLLALSAAVVLNVATVAPVLSPQSVDETRLSGSSRRETAGWVVLVLSGEPRNIGYQLGTLAKAEIEDAHAALRAVLRFNRRPEWTWFREEARRMHWPKVPQDLREEMEGQAEALQKLGSNLDVWDVLAMNAYIELEGYYLPWLEERRTGIRQAGARGACSAFIATGSATADGKIVMGHNFWWDYTMGQRFRFVLDVRPKKGLRFLMDTLPGFIHSATDFAINQAGLVLCETTIAGFHGYDPDGIPAYVRIRNVMQHAENLTEAYDILVTGNNGGYANTWLLGDLKTQEIGMLELGLKNVIFHRTSDGAYVGANFPQDPKLIAEEVRGYSPDPAQNANLRRRDRWNQLLKENRGKVTAAMAKTFLADTVDSLTRRKGASYGTLCGRMDPYGSAHGVTNTKVVDHTLGTRMQFWGRMGISDGSTFSAAPFIQRNPRYQPLAPFLRDIAAYEYVLLPGG